MGVKRLSEVGKTNYGEVRENDVYLLLAGNDTVPITVRRVGGVRCIESRL